MYDWGLKVLIKTRSSTPRLEPPRRGGTVKFIAVVEATLPQAPRPHSTRHWQQTSRHTPGAPTPGGVAGQRNSATWSCTLAVNGPRAEPMQPLHWSASSGAATGCEAGQSSHTERV